MALLCLVPALMGWGPVYNIKTSTIGVVNVGAETPLDIQWRDRLGVRLGYTIVEMVSIIPVVWSGVAVGGIVGSEDELRRGYLVATGGFMPLGVELGPYVQEGPGGMGGGVLGGATLTSGVVAVYGRYGLSTEAHRFAEAGLRLNVPVPVYRHKRGGPIKWVKDGKRRRKGKAALGKRRAGFDALQLEGWALHREEPRSPRHRYGYPMTLTTQLSADLSGQEGQDTVVTLRATGRDDSGRVLKSADRKTERSRWMVRGRYPLLELIEAPVLLWMERDRPSWGENKDFQLEDFTHWTITARWRPVRTRSPSNPWFVGLEEIVWTTDMDACEVTPTRRCMLLESPRLVDRRSPLPKDRRR
jgi:hypothetical protein